MLRGNCESEKTNTSLKNPTTQTNDCSTRIVAQSVKKELGPLTYIKQEPHDKSSHTLKDDLPRPRRLDNIKREPLDAEFSYSMIELRENVSAVKERLECWDDIKREPPDAESSCLKTELEEGVPPVKEWLGCWDNIKQEPPDAEFPCVMFGERHTSYLISSPTVGVDPLADTDPVGLVKADNVPEISPIQCNKCGMSFPNKPALNFHLKNACDRKLRCPKCGRLYIRHVNFYQHTMQDCHRQHKCTKCDCVFSRKISLNRHILSCNASIPIEKESLEDISLFECSGCGKTFKRQTYLDFHIQHECGKPHPCLKCGKVFKGKHTLNKHITHDCGKGHRCAACKKEFQTKASLAKHMRKWALKCELRTKLICSSATST